MSKKAKPQERPGKEYLGGYIDAQVFAKFVEWCRKEFRGNKTFGLERAIEKVTQS